MQIVRIFSTPDFVLFHPSSIITVKCFMYSSYNFLCKKAKVFISKFKEFTKMRWYYAYCYPTYSPHQFPHLNTFLYFYIYLHYILLNSNTIINVTGSLWLNIKVSCFLIVNISKIILVYLSLHILFRINLFKWNG